MKEQVIRSIGLVVSAAVLGGCLVWAAKSVAPPPYEFMALQNENHWGSGYGSVSQRVIRVDKQSGDSEFVTWSKSADAPPPQPTATHGFVEESQVAR